VSPTKTLVMATGDGTSKAITRLLSEIEALLKSATVGMELAKGGVNTSVALIAVQGLTAYIEGNKRRAADDLGTAAEEIRARLET
jgi:hypothetical protein